MFNRESEMYPLLCDFLNEQHYSAFQEFKFGTHHPLEFDVIGIKNTEVFVIEAKMKSYHKVFQQIAVRSIFADYSAIAMPERIAEAIMRNHCDTLVKHGIGLIAVDGIAYELIPPKKNNGSETLKMRIIEGIWRP